MAELMKVPPPPGSSLSLMTRGEREEALWKSHGGPEIERPWVGPVSDIYHGWSSLGRDVNGTSLHSERESWLRVNGWTDPGDQETGHYFFQILEAEMGEIREILHPTPAAPKK